LIAVEERLPFLRAIAANPADDLPRLVFADFLDETGEPDSVARAHFIRAQIALAQLPEGSPEYREAQALQERLLWMYGDDWIWDLPEHLHRGSLPAWRRGFIEFVRMPWYTFAGDAELFDSVPITRVQIIELRMSRGTSAPALAPIPHARRITHLRLGPAANSIRLASILAAAVGRGPSDSLVETRNFTALTHLDLSENIIAGAALVEFLFRFEQASFAPTLKLLDLSRVQGLDDAVGNALATARGLESLDRLILKRTELSEPVRAMILRRCGDRVYF